MTLSLPSPDHHLCTYLPLPPPHQGLFKEEIVPIRVKVTGKDGAVKEVTLDKDDGIRADTTAESLAKLRPAFKEDGTTTAGNASQVTDGAAAVLLMKRKKAQELGLPIIGKWISFAVAGGRALITRCRV